MATAPAQQGIMTLPENDDMTANQQPSMSLNDSYDAVTQGLGNASPVGLDAFSSTISGSMPPELLEMEVGDLSNLLQLFQYLEENPDKYVETVAMLVEAGTIDAGDLPPEHDPEFLSTMGIYVMQALRTKQGGMPGMPEPQGFAMGGIADAVRLVSSQGRGNDTMLAHITQEEANMLRNRGGAGTINPVTGLREYFSFNPFKAVKKVVKKAFKSVTKVVKKVLASPIGRVVATIALATFLGPAAGAATGMLGLGAAGTAAVVSGGLTVLSGGDLKDALISSATAYFGAPGGPVSSFVGQAGITSIAGQAAAASALVGTAASLATGKNLKDSIKAGLTQAAIGGGTAIVSNYMAQADGSKSLMDAINKDAPPPVLTPDQVFAAKQALIPGPNDAPIVDGSGLKPLETLPMVRADGVASVEAPALANQVPVGAGQMPLSPGDAAIRNLNPKYFDSLNPNNSAMGPRMTPNMTPNANRPIGADGFAGVEAAAVAGPTANTAPTGGIGSLVQGAKDLYQGGKDLYNEYLSPSGIAQQGEGAAQQAGMDALSKLPKDAPDFMKKSVYESAVAAARPGIISQYGPLAAAGIGALGVMGGFTPPPQPDNPIAEKLYGTPGQDLIERDPNDYLVQGLPGVQYNSRGAITGSRPWSPSSTMQDVQVAGRMDSSGQNLINQSYSPQSYGGYNPTSGGRYNFLPRYAAEGGLMQNRAPARKMMSGGIANLAQGGYPRRTGQISGPGTEKSDSIPAMLSDGEFVMTAGAVRGAGNGSRRAGAKKMYALMHTLEQNSARG